MLNPQARPRRGPLLTAVAVVVVAAGVAVWALVAMVSATGDRDDAERALARAQAAQDKRADDDTATIARVRDEVSSAAANGIAVLNTLDHRTLDDGLAAWAEVTTGALREEITALGDSQRQQIRDARSVTEGQVVSLAVRTLDTDAGTATVLAASKITSRTGGAEATVADRRVQAELTRTDDGWLLSALDQVPYQEPAG
ncbi:hypothetical protein [Actinophytocola sediminis]